MGFRQELAKNSEKIDSVYDFAAFCYDYLVENVGNQARFLGKYIKENEKAREVNPNLKRLKNLNNSIEQIFLKREEMGFTFQECLESVRVYLKKVKLKEYGDSVLNDATIPFFLLMAIDRYVTEMETPCTDSAPLNKEYCENSYIYLNIGKCLLDDAAEKINFADVIRPIQIKNQVSNLIIMEKKTSH